jgi:hypothetical protein
MGSIRLTEASSTRSAGFRPKPGTWVSAAVSQLTAKNEELQLLGVTTGEQPE